MPRFRDVVIIDEPAIDRLTTSPTGPVGDYLSGLGRQIYTIARNRAPISPKGSNGRPPGYLKTQIYWELTNDGFGLAVHVYTPAKTTDGRDFPYGAAQDQEVLHGHGGHRIKTTPHLTPAFEQVMGRKAL